MLRFLLAFARLFDFVGWMNPTRHWQVERGRALTLDLDEFTFSGVPLGAPLEALEFLGPAEELSFREYRWNAFGVEAVTREGFVETLIFHFLPDESSASWQAFPGAVQYLELPVPVSGLQGISQIREVFGRPLGIERFPDHTILLYDLGDLTLEFELTRDERVASLYLTRADYIEDWE